MNLNRDLLAHVLHTLEKQAYAPPTPQQPPAPPMDPAMMGGMPPMDPAMMGGAPPMPPMDPAMMGGMPPMDPAMMGGAPPMPPMDPAMMGGAPPMDPSMVGGLPPEPGSMPPEDPMAMEGGMPVMLNMDDLKAILAEAGAGGAAQGGESESKRVTNRNLEERIDELEAMLSVLLDAQGLTVPEMPMSGDSGMPAEGAPPAPDTIEPPEPMTLGGQEAIGPMELGAFKTACEQRRSESDGILYQTLRQLNDYR